MFLFALAAFCGILLLPLRGVRNKIWGFSSACLITFGATAARFIGDLWLVFPPLLFICRLHKKRLRYKLTFFELIGIILVGWVFASAIWGGPTGPWRSGVLTFSGYVLTVSSLSAFVRADGRFALSQIGNWSVIPLFSEAASTILFRLQPQIESSYYSLPIAKIFAGSAANDVYGPLGNNVSDPDKAGGIFFLNGNQASMVLGAWGWFFLGLCFLTKRGLPKWFYGVTAGLLWASSLFTGSKSAVAILVVTVWVALILKLHALKPSVSGAFFRVTASILLVGAVPIIGYVVYVFGSTYIQEIDTTMIPRRELWGAAFDLWKSSPIWGSGFDAWDIYWQNVGFGATGTNAAQYPQHDFALMYLDAIGAIGFLLIAILIFTVLGAALKAIRNSREQHHGTQIALICSLIWIVIHGLGDNTSFWGTAHTMVLWGATYGIALHSNLMTDSDEPIAECPATVPQVRT